MVRFIVALLSLSIIVSEIVMANGKVKLGLEVLLSERLDLIRGKHVGLITNQTGVDSQLRSNIDLLYRNPEVKLTALFSPEHGIRGERLAGDYVKSYIDEKTRLPLYSLYGETRKPTRGYAKGHRCPYF